MFLNTLKTFLLLAFILGPSTFLHAKDGSKIPDTASAHATSMNQSDRDIFLAFSAREGVRFAADGVPYKL